MTGLSVIHVVRQFAPGVGGLEEAVLKLCLALRDRNVTTSVLTLDRIATDPKTVLPHAETIRGIPVKRIPFFGSWRYPLAPTVLNRLGAADVVHVHAIDFFFDALAATRVWHRKPLIASTHGGFFHTRFAHRLKQAYFQTATRLSARAYHAVCASSQSDLALFEAIASDRVELVANGVDTTKWADLAPALPRRHLLAIGRLASHKQLPKLFPILQSLRARHPDWRLTIAGAPWDVAPEALWQAAEDAQVAPAVAIVVAPTDAELARLVAEASYVVSASAHEGFGLSAVEGMAAGLVPILNTIPPFKDLIARCGCGLLIDIDDVEKCGAAIERLHAQGVADPESARRRPILCARQFSWAESADRFDRLYRAAIEQRHPIATQPVRPNI